MTNPYNQLRKKIQDYSYGLKDVIGRGFSSVVYRGINEKTKEKVAIKVVDLKSIQGKPQKKMLDGQTQALKKLSHQNIIKCFDIYTTVNNCYIITQFCNEGDLQNLLKRRQKLSQQEAIPIIKQILAGFIHMAQCGFLHRDLKPANILIRDKIVKIADFGFAKKSNHIKDTVNVGSPLYMSPQALKENIYSIKNDIWSLGVIFYQVLHGKTPWNSTNEKQLGQQIMKNSVYLLKSLNEDLKDFIRKCLLPDQKKRIGLKQIINHPFAQRILEQTPILKRQHSKNQQIQPNLQLRKVNSNHQNADVNQVQNNNVGANKPKILYHRQNNGTYSSPDKQFAAQYNWMRYLNRYLQLFPQVQISGRYTLGLRFLTLKLLLSQLQNLQSCFANKNPFLIEGWKQYSLTQQGKRYQKSLQQYRKRFEPFYKQLHEWTPIVFKDKRISSIADCNLFRNQNVSIHAIHYAFQQSKNVWDSIMKQRSKDNESQLTLKQQAQALRLDFTLTFYQLNCFLVDNFTDGQYFARMSKLDIILDYRPIPLQTQNLKDLEHKLKALQIIK